MDKNKQRIQLRTKKLGVLMYDARLAAHQSVKNCARAMKVSVAQYRAYEEGREAPSLPELEALAYFLNIPLQHFWGSQSLSEKPKTNKLLQAEQLLQLRNRIIATRLRQERARLNLTISELAQKSGLSEAEITAWETGQVSIPLPKLEILASSLSLRPEDLFDQKGPIANWRHQIEAREQFGELPQELRDFVCKPVNRPYLELAIRLSNLSVEKLRAVAEGLLEITY